MFSYGDTVKALRTFYSPFTGEKIAEKGQTTTVSPSGGAWGTIICNNYLADSWDYSCFLELYKPVAKLTVAQIEARLGYKVEVVSDEV